MRHTLFILPLLVIVSAVTLLLSYLVPKIRSCIAERRRQPIFLGDDEVVAEVEAEIPQPQTYMPSQGYWSDFANHIKRLRTNGTAIVLLDVLRLLCLSALLALSIYATILAEAPDEGKHGGNSHAHADGFLEALKKKKKKKKNKSVLDQYSTLEWGEFGASIFYVSTLCRLELTPALQPALLLPDPHSPTRQAPPPPHAACRLPPHPRLCVIRLSRHLAQADLLPRSYGR